MLGRAVVEVGSVGLCVGVDAGARAVSCSAATVGIRAGMEVSCPLSVSNDLGEEVPAAVDHLDVFLITAVLRAVVPL